MKGETKGTKTKTLANPTENVVGLIVRYRQERHEKVTGGSDSDNEFVFDFQRGKKRGFPNGEKK